MENIFAWISKNNKKKIVIPLAVVAAIAYTLMLTKGFGFIGDLNIQKMLDTQFVYSGSYFVSTLNSLSPQEVTAYLQIHLIDYVFILTFYPTLTFVFDYLNKHHSNIVILPLIAMIFDFFENILIDLKLLVSIPQFLGSISGIFTVFKFSILIFSAILMVMCVFKYWRHNVEA